MSVEMLKILLSSFTEGCITNFPYDEQRHSTVTALVQ